MLWVVGLITTIGRCGRLWEWCKYVFNEIIELQCQILFCNMLPSPAMCHICLFFVQSNIGLMLQAAEEYELSLCFLENALALNIKLVVSS